MSSGASFCAHWTSEDRLFLPENARACKERERFRGVHMRRNQQQAADAIIVPHRGGEPPLAHILDAALYTKLRKRGYEKLPVSVCASVVKQWVRTMISRLCYDRGISTLENDYD